MLALARFKVRACLRFILNAKTDTRFQKQSVKEKSMSFYLKTLLMFALARFKVRVCLRFI